jgi:sensor domain CHASE-containing protein
MDRLTHDWSAWDDTYNFVENPTDEYIDANLTHLPLRPIS